MSRTGEDPEAVEAGLQARRGGRAHLLRAALFLVLVYVLAGPKLLERWREHEQQSQARSEGGHTYTPELAVPGTPRTPGAVMRATVVDGQIRMSPVPGAQTVLDAGAEIELSADQVKRIEDIAATARAQTDELGRGRAQIEMRLTEEERSNSVDAAELASLAQQIARMDEERIAVQQKSYEDALYVLRPPQKSRMAEILDRG